MMLVPAGDFFYGSTKERMSLPAFYMDQFEVTTKHYAEFMQATKRPQPNYWNQLSDTNMAADRPVIGVDWSDADAYCRYYEKRLPTEQEWEKAARGTDGRLYPWGNQEPTSTSANHWMGRAQEFTKQGNAGRINFYRDRLMSVGSYEADQSPYGIYDLAGNVREWTQSDDTDNGGKVVRGGGWFSAPQTLQAVFRYNWTPSTRNTWLGFRCAQDADIQEVKTSSVLPSPPKATGLPVVAGTPSVVPIGSVQGGTTDVNRSSAFSERSLLLPIVAASRPQPGTITGSWVGLVTSLTVSYAAHGRGPEIETDGNLRAGSLNSLRTAAIVAAVAVGYDPKYLKVRVLIPTVVDGPSAGSMYAVGIASALLGDPIRHDVCMSGTIEPNFEIKPVGRLADKMNACKMLSKTTMIVPDGLDNSHLSFQGTERSVHVIEVHTLSDAYAAATGQSLRPVSSF